MKKGLLNERIMRETVGNTAFERYYIFLHLLFSFSLLCFRGEMSLVGTRPPLLSEWENYDFHHRARMTVKPGITGLWQISGRSEITDFEEVVKLDREYIDNWSVWEDRRCWYVLLHDTL